MTYEKKLRALNRAIKELQKQFPKKPLEIHPPKNRGMIESDPNGLAHLEFCEDMKAIGDFNGNPWGGGDERI